ncbi:MAG: hypothetical protein UHX00_03065, partial [Caryophanon sp.]|nr:hypothetical protein [Caryophanon sp.]
VGHRLHFSVQTEKSGFGKHFVFQIRFYFGLIGQPHFEVLVNNSGLLIILNFKRRLFYGKETEKNVD